MDEFANELIDGMTPKEHENYVIMELKLELSQARGRIVDLEMKVSDSDSRVLYFMKEIHRLHELISWYEKDRNRLIEVLANQERLKTKPDCMIIDDFKVTG